MIIGKPPARRATFLGRPFLDTAKPQPVAVEQPSELDGFQAMVDLTDLCRRTEGEIEAFGSRVSSDPSSANDEARAGIFTNFAGEAQGVLNRMADGPARKRAGDFARKEGFRLMDRAGTLEDEARAHFVTSQLDRFQRAFADAAANPAKAENGVRLFTHLVGASGLPQAEAAKVRDAGIAAIRAAGTVPPPNEDLATPQTQSVASRPRREEPVLDEPVSTRSGRQQNGGGRGVLGTVSDVASDVAHGTAETGTQIVGGIRDGVQALLDGTDAIAEWLEERVPLGGIRILNDRGELDIGLVGRAPEEYGIGLPEVEGPESATGGNVRGVAQFLAGFGVAGRALAGLKAASRAGKIGKAALQGALADFGFFGPHEQRLSDLIEAHPDLHHPISAFLASDPQDTEAVGRFKNTLEGLGLGVAADGLVRGLRVLKLRRQLSHEIGDGRPETPADGARAAADTVKSDPRLDADLRRSLALQSRHPNFPAAETNPASHGIEGARVFGLIDPVSSKRIVQPLDSVEGMLDMGARNREPLKQALETAVNGLDGVQVVGVRVKEHNPHLERKLAGRRADTLTDYLGGRITVDKPEDFDRVLEVLTKRYQNVELDDFLTNPRKTGYRAVHVQVVLDSGMTAEVQIMPSPVFAIFDVEHGIYDTWRDRDVLTPLEKRMRLEQEEWARRNYQEAFNSWLSQ